GSKPDKVPARYNRRMLLAEPGHTPTPQENQLFLVVLVSMGVLLHAAIIGGSFAAAWLIELSVYSKRPGRLIVIAGLAISAVVIAVGWFTLYIPGWLLVLALLFSAGRTM